MAIIEIEDGSSNRLLTFDSGDNGGGNGSDSSSSSNRGLTLSKLGKELCVLRSLSALLGTTDICSVAQVGDHDSLLRTIDRVGVGLFELGVAFSTFRTRLTLRRQDICCPCLPRVGVGATAAANRARVGTRGLFGLLGTSFRCGRNCGFVLFERQGSGLAEVLDGGGEEIYLCQDGFRGRNQCGGHLELNNWIDM